MEAEKKRGPILQKGKCLIGVALTGDSRTSLCENARAIAAEHPDLVEWRADRSSESPAELFTDGLPDELRTILGDVPFLFTFRTKAEGGCGTLERDAYMHLLQAAADVPAFDLLDVEALQLGEEVAPLIRALQSAGKEIVASAHAHRTMPDIEELDRRLKALQETGADAYKIVCMAGNAKEAERFRAWTMRQSQRIERPLIAFAMGEAGTDTRVFAKEAGSALTFAYVGEAVAPGQISIAELRRRRE